MPFTSTPLLSRRLFATAALSALAGCSRAARSVPFAASAPLDEAVAAPPAPLDTTAPPRVEAAPDKPGLPLFEAYPRLGQAIARAPLGLFPTPVDHASALGAHLGVGALYVKRDDVSGALYGGGKTRKLELFFGDAQRGGHATVITFGSVGSHHTVATAVYAKVLQMKAILMLLPQPSDELVRASLLAEVRLGATIRLSPGARGAERAARRALLASGDRREPYVIPVGGSSPLGTYTRVSVSSRTYLPPRSSVRRAATS